MSINKACVGKPELIRLHEIRSFYLSLVWVVIIPGKQAYKAVEMARKRLETRAEK